jgi:signal transduction histidine kinase
VRDIPKTTQATDVAISLLVVLGVAVWSGGLDPLGWAAVALAGLTLCLRRRFPVSVAAVTLVVVMVYYALSAVDGPVWPAFLIALYTVATRADLIVPVGFVTVALLAFAYEGRNGSSPQLTSSVPLLLAGWMIAALLIGTAVHHRRSYLREVRQHAADAAAKRAVALNLSAAEERLRIARELYDVLGHHLSQINVEAAATLHRLPGKDLDEVEGALTAIKKAGKDALRELRTTLGVLRQVDEAPTR